MNVAADPRETVQTLATREQKARVKLAPRAREFTRVSIAKRIPRRTAERETALIMMFDRSLFDSGEALIQPHPAAAFQ